MRENSFLDEKEAKSHVSGQAGNRGSKCSSPGCGQEAAAPPPSRGLFQEDPPHHQAELHRPHAARGERAASVLFPSLSDILKPIFKTSPRWHKVLCFPKHQCALFPFLFPSPLLFQSVPLQGCRVFGMHRQHTKRRDG